VSLPLGFEATTGAATSEWYRDASPAFVLLLLMLNGTTIAIVALQAPPSRCPQRS